MNFIFRIIIKYEIQRHILDFNFFKKAEIVVINEHVAEECDVVPLTA